MRGLLRLAVLFGGGAVLWYRAPGDAATVVLSVALAVSAVAPSVARRWLGARERLGWGVSAADAVLIGLCLLRGGPGPAQSAVLGAYFVAVLVAVLAAGSPGWFLAGLAGPGLFLSLRVGSGLPIDGETWVYALHLTASSFYFLHVTHRADRVTTDYRRVRDERRELWTLLEITDAVTSTLDLREVMRSIVRRVGDLVGAENCSIVLADSELRGCFVLAASERPDVDMLEVDLAKYPELRRAIETREPVVIDDVENDPVVASVRDVLVRKGYRSVLVLPLLFGQEVLGTLFLRASRNRPFTPAELRFCKVAAGASANALKNAMLYRQVRRESERHRETGETLRRVLDCSPDLILATDVEGRVTTMNGPALRLAGTGIREPAASIDDVLQCPGLAADAALGGDGATSREITIEAEPPGAREVQLVSAPLRAADGAVTGRVWVGRDVTDIRRAERSLARVERLSTLGEIVAGVAHELNNPLSAVLGYSELLRRNAERESDIADLERVVDSARRCKRIVQNLLGFARRHQPERTRADLNLSVRKVLELRSYPQRAAGIETVLDLEPDLPATLFDPYQIEQILMNLVTNAEQAIRGSDRGGAPAKITVRTRCHGDEIVLEVEDDGPGIAADAFARIFDPFFTTKEIGQGTGLGLSMSFGIAREHGGNLEARPPVPGRGACFVLTLPRTDEASSSAETEPEGTAEGLEAPLSGRRVLVAEDEPDVRTFLRRVLDQEGVEVTEASDGEEAWEKLAHAEFDLVIADVRMPRMGGQELYERVAEERPDLLRRMVFASGDLACAETMAFLERLPNRLLAKPFQLETVRHVLRGVLRQIAS